MPNAQKLEEVSRIKELFDGNNAYFVTDYQGLNVAEMTTLRKKLREQNIKFIIAKNTLVRVASEQAGVAGIGEHLNGPTAIAFTKDDAAVAAKILHDSFKERELPRMKVFVVEEEVFSGGDIQKLADLPTKDELLGMIASAVEAPVKNVAMLIDAFFQGLLGVIEALAEKKKSEN
ncbi:MAG: 50S ribosomal protein L10 [candidate division Zixibacteria bacterium]